MSYAVRQLVNTNTEHGLFYVWPESNKIAISNESDELFLKKYIEFSAQSLNQFLNAAKAVLTSDRWTTDKGVKNRVLTTTAINGFIICLRLVIEHDKTVHTVQEQ